MDRNIIMAIATVALIAIVFIGVAIVRQQPDSCPTDIRIYTEKKSYEIGEEVHLSLKSANLPRISTYEWTTEDERSSNQPSPVFVFDKKSMQEVVVKINEGCEYRYVFEIVDTVDKDVEEIFVTEGEVSVSKKTAFVGEELQFKDNSEGASAHWWNFGDANSSSSQNPAHSYSRPGKYTVSRMLNGDESMMTTINIVIKERNTPIPQDPKQTAKFAINKNNPNAGEIVNFTDQTTNARSWLWNFGDGYTSQERNPTHVYNFAGNYIIMLSVNGTGKDVSTQTLKVSAPIIAPAPTPTSADAILPTPSLPVKMDLATTLKSKFQEIARSSNDELKTNIYYNDLLPNVADENMPVKISRNGQQIEDTFYDYYNSLNIQGGQQISRVEVLNTDAEGKATSLRVFEQ